MQTKLRQCSCCKEWFNTTFEIMIEHYKLKHEFQINKAFAIAETVVKINILQMKAKLAPFPENIQLSTAALMAQAHLETIIAASPQ